MATSAEIPICPICLEQVQQPKVLICNHRICFICLEKLVYHSGEEIKCPECRTIILKCREGILRQPNNNLDYSDDLGFGSIAESIVTHTPSEPSPNVLSENFEELDIYRGRNVRNFVESATDIDNSEEGYFAKRFRFQSDTIVREIYAVTKIFTAFDHRWYLSVHRDPDTSCLCVNLILKSRGPRKFEFCEAFVNMCVLNYKDVPNCLETRGNKTFIPGDFDLMYNWRTSLTWDVFADTIQGFVKPDGSFDLELSLKVKRTLWIS